jgi:hypothetical protein
MPINSCSENPEFQDSLARAEQNLSGRHKYLENTIFYPARCESLSHSPLIATNSFLENIHIRNTFSRLR